MMCHVMYEFMYVHLLGCSSFFILLTFVPLRLDHPIHISSSNPKVTYLSYVVVIIPNDLPRTTHSWSELPSPLGGKNVATQL